MAIEACFAELGLTSDANLTEVKKALKKIAITTHPDKNNDPAAADKFRTVNNAYATLLDWFRDNPPKGRRKQDESPDSSDVKVTEHSQCIVVKIGKSTIQHFIDACYELYGEPRDLGKHGQKYSATFKSLDPENEGNSTPNRLGSVHVTVYKSTGNVMTQGACYLLWHAEHLPHLLQSIRPETPASSSALKYKPESPALNIENESDSNENCSVCDLEDTDFMLECDACKLWMHYACSKVFPESRLQELTSERRSVFVCWQCESVPIPAIAPPPLKDDASHTSEAKTAPDTQNSYAKSHEAIIAAISSMERNITDSMMSVINEKSSVLNDKFNAELSALANKHKLQVASLESQIGELKKDNKRYGESLCTERNAHQLEVDAQQEKINLLSERLQISKEALTKSNSELAVTKKKLAETQADLESKFTKISELTSRNQELMSQLQATQKDLCRGPARPLRKYRNLYRKKFGKIQDFTGYNLEKKRKNKGIIK